MASTGTMSDFLVHQTLDAAMSDGTFPVIADVYIMLSTTTISPGDNASAATEPDAATPVWSDYARVITLDANWDAATARNKNYNADVDFGTATTTGDVDITDWAIVDSASGAGNMLYFGLLDGIITVQNGNPVKVTANNLDISVLSAQA